MRHGLRFHHVLMGTLGLIACAIAAARGADDKKYKTYEFESADGVKLEGNLWSNAGAANKKDATVLLLHDMTKTGGSSRDEGWDLLGDKLLSEGYSVFSFDFRGFGGSKSVNPDKFWDLRKNQQNQMVRGANKMPRPETIDHADFEHSYYPYLVNDVEAAKGFLDRRNDSGEVNTSSLFVIGAGEGATVGALWMASQWHLQKGNLGPLGTVLVDQRTGKFSLQEPEGKDQAGAIWLSISPTLGGRSIGSYVHNWVGEVGGMNRVPMAFLYGGKDAAGKRFAGECLEAVIRGYRRANGSASLPQLEVTEKMAEKKPSGDWKLPDTIKFAVGSDTTLVGNKLLSDESTTATVIHILNHVMGDRKNLESKKHDNDGAAFFWKFESPIPMPAKEPTDPTLPLIPVSRFMR